MKTFRTMEVSASALTAERLRMDVIANNLANLNTTRTAAGGPYRRRYVVQAERQADFQNQLQQELGRVGEGAGGGVQIANIAEDPSEFKLKYDPTHPDAGPDGMVRLPNVDLLTEVSDMMIAVRAYQANVSVFNASKSMALKALEIGK